VAHRNTIKKIGTKDSNRTVIQPGSVRISEARIKNLNDLRDNKIEFVFKSDQEIEQEKEFFVKQHELMQ